MPKNPHLLIHFISISLFLSLSRQKLSNSHVLYMSTVWAMFDYD